MLELACHLEDLQQHMYTQYRNGLMCDLEMLTKDGATFKAHKLVLTAASRYLYNMCIQTTDASFFFDIHSEDLHMLLEFCYTGKLCISPDRWPAIQQAAESLQMFSVLQLLNGQLGPGSSSTLYPSEVLKESIGSQGTLTDCIQQTGSQDSTLNGTSHWPIDQMNDEASDVMVTEVTGHDNERDRSKCSTNKYATSQSQTTQYSTRTYTGSRSFDHVQLNESEPQTRSRSSKSVSYTGVKSHKRWLPKVTDLNTKSELFTCGNEKISSTRLNETHNKGTDCGDKDIKSKLRQRRKAVSVHPGNKNGSKSKRNVKEKKLSDVRAKSKQIQQKSVSFIHDEKINSRIMIKLKDLKLTQIGCKRIKRQVSNFGQVLVPRNSRKMCRQCGKVYTSAVGLHTHRLFVHLANTCSQLRYKYLLKKAKQKSSMKTCVTHTGVNRKNIECRLCGGRFSKYSQYSSHVKRKHEKMTKPMQSWLRYCSVKLAIQKLLVPFAKDRKCNNGTDHKLEMRNSSTKERKFKCSKCEKGFLTQYTLAAHERNAHGAMATKSKITRSEIKMPTEPLFLCVKCREAQRTMRALFCHLQGQHGCDNKEAVRLQHHTPDFQQCELCEFKTQDLHVMKSHVIVSHPFVKYPCTECHMSFKVELLLKRHKFMCHVTGKLNFHCQVCKKSFRKGAVLKKHEYFKHGIEHENVKVFHCIHEGCTYKTYTSSAIKSHLNKHVKEKLFPCQYCGLKLKTAKIHEKHVAKMHLGIRPFLCQVCGLNFGEKHELQSHITNRHTEEKTYQCQFCPYTTAVKATFFTHMFNVHKVREEDDKRELFRCPYCPFTSILRYRYQTHVNGHTNTRNYECKLCQKSFVSASTLRAHNQWLHSDKVFSCTQCDYQTKTRQKLNEHVRVQHQLQGFKPYKCPYCTFRCATGGNTRKHVKQVHKGEVVTYIRDDELLSAARIARASGQCASLFATLSNVQLEQDVREEDRSELAENILHIAL